MAPKSFLLVFLALAAFAAGEEDLNLRPIIGILSQELSRGMERVLEGRNFTSYIAASYVKFYESAGARVVPILINQPDEYYANLMNSLNGIVFPGGSASITEKSGYGRAGRVLYDLLLQAAQEGNVIPLHATCLGFEMLLYLHSRRYPLSSCKASNRADALVLQPEWEKSKLLGNASEEIVNTLNTTKSTSNFHKKCITPEKFEELKLGEDFYLLSTNFDDDEIEYVSTVEHKTLPIVGFQWHPEKNLFEWAYDSIPHTREAIEAAQYTANLFVDEARKNKQSFATEEAEIAALIYNYVPIYIRLLYKSSFQQCYFF